MDKPDTPEDRPDPTKYVPSTGKWKGPVARAEFTMQRLFVSILPTD